MSLSPLMLSMAAPIAVDSIGAVASFAQDVGRSFAQALNEVDTSEPVDQSFGERFAAFSEGLRNWLKESGISSPFEINFTQAGADQPPRVEVSGDEANQISSLLEQHPSWKQGLVGLAKSLQAITGELSPDAVSLRIRDRN